MGETNKAIELFNSIKEEDIENGENKDFTCLFYLNKTLFEIYKQNKDIAKKYLIQAFEVIEEEYQLSLMIDYCCCVNF